MCTCRGTCSEIATLNNGGWVNSQIFDHTSTIRFLETRLGVIEANMCVGGVAIAHEFKLNDAEIIKVVHGHRPRAPTKP